MIEAILPPECYTDPSWFKLEQEKIFKKHWLFFGFEQQLLMENDFIARDYSGTPVLVQRVGGALRAFRNACAHRGMPLQTQPCGNRKLICPYHGWSFHGNGRLRGIPNEKIYKICKEDKEKISLQTYALQQIGSFIFVNLSPDPFPIGEQISEEIQAVLREFSSHFSPQISYASFPGNYNWKLNFENILDWNHAQFVHPRTFAPLLAFEGSGNLAAAPVEASPLFGPGGPLENLPQTGTQQFSEKIHLRDVSVLGRTKIPYAKRWYSDLLEQTLDPGALTTCHMFPNLSFGSIHGEHYYVQQYVPLDANRIQYHSWILTNKLKKDVPPQPHLLWGIHHAEKRVVDEDVFLFHALQKALQTAPTVGIMGEHEAPLATFGKWYMQNLKGH